MIKFEHTVFALPFAFIGALLARKGLPAAWQAGWIVAAMVGARSAAGMFWVAGFDLIYALQDIEFDREAKLFSLPSRFGIGPALRISTLFHIATVILLTATAILTNLGWIAFAGIAIVAGILYWE